MGDPTLRMRMLTPVSNLNGYTGGGTTTLNWSSGEPDCQYYVFKAPTIDGPFTYLYGPTTATTYIDGSTGSKYMVRAAKLLNAGRGSSYMNLS